MAESPSPVSHRLAGFTGAGYDKGRSTVWQAVWFATERAFISAWWFPMRWKPVVLRAFGAQVGRDVHIRHTVRILWPWKLVIGDHTWIGEGAWLLNLEPITIGANVCISQEAFLCTGSHQHSSETFEFDNAPITIEDDVWVAAQAMLLRGVTVGQGALIGARAVIASSVPPGARVSAGSKF